MDGAIAPKRARILGGGGGNVAAIKFTRTTCPTINLEACPYFNLPG
jgi:hypothetical protein